MAMIQRSVAYCLLYVLCNPPAASKMHEAPWLSWLEKGLTRKSSGLASFHTGGPAQCRAGSISYAAMLCREQWGPEQWCRRQRRAEQRRRRTTWQRSWYAVYPPSSSCRHTVSHEVQRLGIALRCSLARDPYLPTTRTVPGGSEMEC